MKGWKFGTLTKNLDMNYIDMSSIKSLNLWIHGWYGKPFSEKHNTFSVANFQLMILYSLGMKFFVLILMPCNLVLWMTLWDRCTFHKFKCECKRRFKKLTTHENLIEWWLQTAVEHWGHGNICQFSGVAIIWHQFFNKNFREVECQIHNMVQPSMENSIGFFPSCFSYFV
jgi:hypothetical protein